MVQRKHRRVRERFRKVGRGWKEGGKRRRINRHSSSCLLAITQVDGNSLMHPSPRSWNDVFRERSRAKQTQVPMFNVPLMIVNVFSVLYFSTSPSLRSDWIKDVNMCVCAYLSIYMNVDRTLRTPPTMLTRERAANTLLSSV